MTFEFAPGCEDILSLRFSAELPFTCCAMGGSPTSYIEISSPNEQGDFTVVARSSPVKAMKAKYPEIKIKISDLCNNDYYRPLRGEILVQGWFSSYTHA